MFLLARLHYYLDCFDDNVTRKQIQIECYIRVGFF